MSRPSGGYLGGVDKVDETTDTRSGVCTHQDVMGLYQQKQPPFMTLQYPSAYGAFGNGPTISYTLAQAAIGFYLDFNDTTSPKTAGGYKLTLNDPGRFEVHLWGSGGIDGVYPSTGYSGPGGYTKYTADLGPGVYGLYLSGHEYSPFTTASINGGWPDGGDVQSATNNGQGGGGSTRFGPWYATLAAANASTATYYAIAGGGGGSHQYFNAGGAGGGLSGTAAPSGSYGAGGGGGGTQTAGGTGGAASSYGGTGGNGSKYQGGYGYAYSSYGGGGAGGGGYYGGGAGGTVYACGGGGSGYIDTGFSGYVSGSTTAGTTSTSSVPGTSPAGVGVSKVNDGGNPNKGGLIYIKKI